MRVLLILVDGMRPDALTDVPAAQSIIKQSAHTMTAKTVFPSVTKRMDSNRVRLYDVVSSRV